MSEKVVLPKFDLPGKQMHPAVKLLLTVGGLLALSIVALVGALWRHHAQEVAEENRKQAEIAAKMNPAAAAAGDPKAGPVAKHHGHHAKKDSKTTVAKGGATDEKAKTGAKAGGGKKGDDVVDKLLASFK